MPPIAMRSIARRFIPEMLRMGWTTTKGLALLRAEGMGYRRTDFLADWREFSGRAKKQSPLKVIPKKYRPTAATVQITEGVQRKKFNYNYQVTGYDTFLEKEVTTGYTVSSETVLTMEQALEQAGVSWMKYKEEIIDTEFEIESVTQRKT